MIYKSFWFKPISKKDHFESIKKGVNDRNQIFDRENKVLSLTDVNPHEDIFFQIVVSENNNEEEIDKYINAKIALYWIDYKYSISLIFRYKKRKKAKELLKLTKL